MKNAFYDSHYKLHTTHDRRVRRIRIPHRSGVSEVPSAADALLDADVIDKDSNNLVLVRVLVYECVILRAYLYLAYFITIVCK